MHNYSYDLIRLKKCSEQCPDKANLSHTPQKQIVSKKVEGVDQIYEQIDVETNKSQMQLALIKVPSGYHNEHSHEGNLKQPLPQVDSEHNTILSEKFHSPSPNSVI